MLACGFHLHGISLSVLSLTVYMYLYKWSECSYRQHIIGMFLIHLSSRYLPSREFNLFSFKAIIHRWEHIPVILLIVFWVFCISFVPFFLSYVYHCSLVVFCSGEVWLPSISHLCVCPTSEFYMFICFCDGRDHLSLPDIGLP